AEGVLKPGRLAEREGRTRFSHLARCAEVDRLVVVALFAATAEQHTGGHHQHGGDRSTSSHLFCSPLLPGAQHGHGRGEWSRSSRGLLRTITSTPAPAACGPACRCSLPRRRTHP